jgi:RsmE family RNA methyltransferase
LTVAVAPPSSKDRQRFLVEKLAELGVARLVWLKTLHGKNRVAHPTKVFSWILAAVEQSQGAWLMEVSPDLVELSDIEGKMVVCQPGGATGPISADVVVIGPEGGFADDELPTDIPRWDLGPNVLRVETAALVAAARITAR